MQEDKLFHCSTCNYSTYRNYDYCNHLKSKKHNRLRVSTTISYVCDKCQEAFKFSSGLSRHKKTCKYVSNSSILSILQEHFHNNKNLVDTMNEIRIDNNYYSGFKEKNYLDIIKPLFLDTFEKIPLTEIPIICIRNENPDMDIVYIRDNDKWRKENKCLWLKQIISELENNVKDEECTILFKGFRIFERNLLNDIHILFKNKVPGFYAFEKRNKNEMTYYMNKMELVDYFIELIKINKEDFQNKVFELSQTKTEL